MAEKNPVSFDEIIQADREKKQKEELANQLLLGKNRTTNAPGSGSRANKKAQHKTQDAKPGSLASRIGVTKRTASPTGQPNKNKSAPITNHTRPRNHYGRKDRINSDQVQAAFTAENVAPSAPGGDILRIVGGSNSDLSIKGASGPFIVVGRNFAPGTTAADIQSALEPITGPMLSCRITANYPSVVAEFAYGERSAAELVVANFHNQRADGRLLTMTLKTNQYTPPSTPFDPFSALRAQADQERIRARGGLGLRNDLLGQTQGNSQPGLYSDAMTVDAPARNTQKYRRKWNR
ncbi:uncharacterized protein N7515_002674 [Penicillium bovifimosum]|uniref:RRM domain-containing protein n=1 Tax=Penicillium bovifimosum TaxID=126998 RepID=A0A9W9HC43_9EURO|nr:uncharacterized protein N7515_002674 [Penicillium bovifimosum]KAJ5143887.1 hypothetical protein N7515_002674 [Penicillium bovifimosum]